MSLFFLFYLFRELILPHGGGSSQECFPRHWQAPVYTFRRLLVARYVCPQCERTCALQSLCRNKQNYTNPPGNKFLGVPTVGSRYKRIDNPFLCSTKFLHKLPSKGWNFRSRTTHHRTLFTIKVILFFFFSFTTSHRTTV